MAATAVIGAIALAGTAYQVSSTEQAKRKANEKELQANDNQKKVEDGLALQEKIKKNNIARDAQRQQQETAQAQAAGRGSTILTGPVNAGGGGIGVGQATSSGGGKTLLGM